MTIKDLLAKRGRDKAAKFIRDNQKQLIQERYEDQELEMTIDQIFADLQGFEFKIGVGARGSYIAVKVRDKTIYVVAGWHTRQVRYTKDGPLEDLRCLEIHISFSHEVAIVVCSPVAGQFPVAFADFLQRNNLA